MDYSDVVEKKAFPGSLIKNRKKTIPTEHENGYFGRDANKSGLSHVYSDLYNQVTVVQGMNRS